MNKTEQLLRWIILGIKTAFLLFGYPLLALVEATAGIALYSLQDVGAMKLNAVAGRGAKKDFWDLAVLLSGYYLSENYGLVFPEISHC